MIILARLSLTYTKRSYLKSVFPLLYLLLENDYRKIKAAQKMVLTSDEWMYSGVSMDQVFAAVGRRHEELSGMSFGLRFLQCSLQ